MIFYRKTSFAFEFYYTIETRYLQMKQYTNEIKIENKLNCDVYFTHKLLKGETDEKTNNKGICSTFGMKNNSLSWIFGCAIQCHLTAYSCS